MNVTHRQALQARSAISANDGYGTVRPVGVLVVIDSYPSPADEVGLLTDTHREWVARYLDGKDMRLVLDFPPTPLSLALYLANTFSASDPAVARVSVSFDGDEVFLVDVE